MVDLKTALRGVNVFGGLFRASDYLINWKKHQLLLDSPFYDLIIIRYDFKVRHLMWV